MKILLIAPASGKWQHVGRSRVFGGKAFRFSLLSLLSVAAESPEDADVRIVDEQIEKIPWDADVDLVGITCMTAVAPRAYEIARHFRGRGIPVVLGGMHPTLCPDEAIQHADAMSRETQKVYGRRCLQMSRAGVLRGSTAMSNNDPWPTQATAASPAVSSGVRHHQRRPGHTWVPAWLRFLCNCCLQRTYPATTAGRGSDCGGQGPAWPHVHFC